MTNTLPRPSLVLVTSRRRLSPDARTARDEWQALEAFLDRAIDARVDVIQIRESDADAGQLGACVEAIARRGAAADVKVIVNDRLDVAIACGADGVHLPAHGLPSERARRLMPAGVIGRSVHQGEGLDPGGLDYLLFGTVFPSESKPGLEAAGLGALADTVARSRRPVLAIGGITPSRARACLEAGASGVAAIGAFLPPGCAPDAMGVGPAVRAFREALSRIC